MEQIADFFNSPAGKHVMSEIDLLLRARCDNIVHRAHQASLEDIRYLRGIVDGIRDVKSVLGQMKG